MAERVEHRIYSARSANRIKPRFVLIGVRRRAEISKSFVLFGRRGAVHVGALQSGESENGAAYSTAQTVNKYAIAGFDLRRAIDHLIRRDPIEHESGACLDI